MSDKDVKKTTDLKMAWAKIVARASFDPAFCHSLEHEAVAAFEGYGVEVPDDIDLNSGVEPSLDEALDAINNTAHSSANAPGSWPNYAASMMSPFSNTPAASAQFSCWPPTPQFSSVQPTPQFSCWQSTPQFSCVAPPAQAQFSCVAAPAQAQFSCLAAPAQAQFSCVAPQAQFSCVAPQAQFSCV
jgi:hypothetical protein